MHTCLALGIGFEQETYTFLEPDNRTRHEVILIKEDDRISEQTFSVIVNIGDPISGLSTASLDTDDGNTLYDYSLEDRNLSFIFTPSIQNHSFVFFLREDNSPEGTEAFRVTSTPDDSSDYPTFQPPMSPGSSIRSAYQNAEIQIFDNDSKLIS